MLDDFWKIYTHAIFTMERRVILLIEKNSCVLLASNYVFLCLPLFCLMDGNFIVASIKIGSNQKHISTNCKDITYLIFFSLVFHHLIKSNGAAKTCKRINRRRILKQIDSLEMPFFVGVDI